MKKLIAILAIMIVLVGAVFAAASESHTLYVEAEILGVDPIFQLIYGSEAPSNGTATFGDGTALPGTLTTTPTYGIGSAADRVDVKADLDADKAITITAQINNAAKIYRLYTLAFSDGVFSDVPVGDTHYDLVPVITTDPTSAQTVSSTKGISAITETEEGKVNVQFDGTQMVNTAALALTTATFTYDGQAAAVGTRANYNWDSATINPGKYTANIVLTISTT